MQCSQDFCYALCILQGPCVVHMNKDLGHTAAEWLSYLSLEVSE